MRMSLFTWIGTELFVRIRRSRPGFWLDGQVLSKVLVIRRASIE